MVVIKGVKGSIPLPQELLIERRTETCKKYSLTDNGKKVIREGQKRYELTDKAKLRHKRFFSKVFHCELCNVDIKVSSRYRHIKSSKKHLSNL